MSPEPRSLKHAGGENAFYLATHPADAQHFAALAAEHNGGGAAMIRYVMSNKAVSALQASGAYFSPIAPGKNYNPAGSEFVIPERAYPTFNALLGTGDIKPMPPLPSER